MGDRGWLAKQIQERYLPLLRDLQDTAKGHKAAKKLCLEIRQDWAKRNLLELSQQQGCMDQLRRAIKDSLGEDHFSLDFIGFSTEEYVELNNQKQKRVGERNEQVKFLDNPDAIVAKAVRLLESPEWAEIASGLALLTGRRITELLSTAHFQKKTQWSVTFTGALKRKGEVQTLSFEIPTLTTADKVIQALERIRRELPEAVDLPASNINRSYQSAVIQACDQHFSGLIPIREGRDNLYTHGQRAVYATIATFWYCPPWVNETEYKASIQGHYQLLDEANPDLRRSLAASRHYSDYEIADSVIAQHQGKRKGIKLGVSGIEPIETFKRSSKEEAQQMPSERRKTASLRVWNTDRARLDEILRRLDLDEGVQQDKISGLLSWIVNQLDGTATTTQADNQPPQAEQPKTATTVEPTTVIPTTLEAQLSLLIGTMNSFVEVQKELIAAPTTRQTQKEASPPAADQQEAEPKAKRVKEPSSADGRVNLETDRIINQAIDAIMAWNDEPGRLHDLKWAITINTLKSFVNSQPKIQKILLERADQIKAHHQKHQIDPAKHNLRHRGKQQVSHVIKLVE